MTNLIHLNRLWHWKDCRNPLSLFFLHNFWTHRVRYFLYTFRLSENFQIFIFSFSDIRFGTIFFCKPFAQKFKIILNSIDQLEWSPILNSKYWSTIDRMSHFEKVDSPIRVMIENEDSPENDQRIGFSTWPRLTIDLFLNDYKLKSSELVYESTLPMTHFHYFRKFAWNEPTLAGWIKC